LHCRGAGPNPVADAQDMRQQNRIAAQYHGLVGQCSRPAPAQSLDPESAPAAPSGPTDAVVSGHFRGWLGGPEGIRRGHQLRRPACPALASDMSAIGGSIRHHPSHTYFGVRPCHPRRIYPMDAIGRKRGAVLHGLCDRNCVDDDGTAITVCYRSRPQLLGPAHFRQCRNSAPSRQTRPFSRSRIIATGQSPILPNEMTALDHALTRPWTVHKTICWETPSLGR